MGGINDFKETREVGKLKEVEIRQNIKRREAIIAENLLLAEQDLTRHLVQLQKEHQKVLYWETQAGDEEKRKFANLRQEIERQQQRMVIPQQRAYRRLTLKFVPPQTVLKNTFFAFLIGGLICLLGQVFHGIFVNSGLAEKEAGAAASSLLIFLGAFFTALGYYDQLGKVAGAGSLVPITGFANSIVSSGLEFKREGYIYGVGAHLFTVAGPVIAYGTMLSIFFGLIYFFIK